MRDGKPLAPAPFPTYNVDYGNSAKDKMRGNDRRILNDNLGKRLYRFLYDARVNILTLTKGSAYIRMSSSEPRTPRKARTEAGGPGRAGGA